MEKTVFFPTLIKTHHKKTQDLDAPRETSSQKIKTKRIATQDKKWIADIPFEECLQTVEHFYLDPFPYNAKIRENIQRQICQKMSGYKYQDIKNGIYNMDEFIQFPQIIALLQTSQLSCYYCQNKVQLLHEWVREPCQWTLERLDNDKGHNSGNVVISCLSCNLRRRTMYHERFLFTKQIGKQSIVKLDG